VRLSSNSSIHARLFDELFVQSPQNLSSMTTIRTVLNRSPSDRFLQISDHPGRRRQARPHVMWQARSATTMTHVSGPRKHRQWHLSVRSLASYNGGPFKCPRSVCAPRVSAPRRFSFPYRVSESIRAPIWIASKRTRTQSGFKIIRTQLSGLRRALVRIGTEFRRMYSVACLSSPPPREICLSGGCAMCCSRSSWPQSDYGFTCDADRVDEAREQIDALLQSIERHRAVSIIGEQFRCTECSTQSTLYAMNRVAFATESTTDVVPTHTCVCVCVCCRVEISRSPIGAQRSRRDEIKIFFNSIAPLITFTNSSQKTCSCRFVHCCPDVELVILPDGLNGNPARPGSYCSSDVNRPKFCMHARVTRRACHACYVLSTVPQKTMSRLQAPPIESTDRTSSQLYADTKQTNIVGRCSPVITWMMARDCSELVPSPNPDLEPLTETNKTDLNSFERNRSGTKCSTNFLLRN
jgi:hypothetical protein